MKIAVIGAGAMGSLFGGSLSARHEVTLIDTNPDVVQAILAQGVTIVETTGEKVFRPHAAISADGIGIVDTVILFVKAMYSDAALQGALPLIGPETTVLTLQNGAGHERTLAKYIPLEQIAIGTTQHNASIQSPGRINHGGGGMTYIGGAEANREKLAALAKALTDCGFETAVSGDVRRLIWQKLMLNASASVLTGILQVRLGFFLESGAAWQLVTRLVQEAVAVANAEGMGFDADATLAEIRTRLEGSREGITSICADLRDGRLTEVETISGAVVAPAREAGVPAPTHEAMVALVHAMEDRRLPESGARYA